MKADVELKITGDKYRAAMLALDKASADVAWLSAELGFAEVRRGMARAAVNAACNELLDIARGKST